MENLLNQIQKCDNSIEMLCGEQGKIGYLEDKLANTFETLDDSKKQKLYSFVSNQFSRLEKDIISLNRMQSEFRSKLNDLLIEEIVENIQDSLCPILKKITGKEYEFTGIVLTNEMTNMKVSIDYCYGAKRQSYPFKDGFAFLSYDERFELYLKQNEAILRGDLIYFEENPRVLSNEIVIGQNYQLEIETGLNPFIFEHKEELESELNNMFWVEKAESKAPLILEYQTKIKEFIDKYHLGEEIDETFYNMAKSIFEDKEEYQQ